jgi:hypothetical protein
LGCSSTDMKSAQTTFNRTVRIGFGGRVNLYFIQVLVLPFYETPKNLDKTYLKKFDCSSKV